MLCFIKYVSYKTFSAKINTVVSAKAHVLLTAIYFCHFFGCISPVMFADKCKGIRFCFSR